MEDCACGYPEHSCLLEDIDSGETSNPFYLKHCEKRACGVGGEDGGLHCN